VTVRSRRTLPLVSGIVLAAIVTLASAGLARAGSPPALGAAVDEAARRTLAETHAPSASVAVVFDGAIAYTRAYGSARLAPEVAATPAMRYPIGSISKQFTAALLVTLAQEGRLSLDDRLSKWFPDLTRADDVTVRQLLSHTAGIRDYWPQDYVPATMLEPIAPRELLDRFARAPLDFEPGARLQYSNTGFVIAAAIAEQAGGQPLFEQLRARFFEPLGMSSVTDVDQGTLGPGDPAGYLAYALGPPRPAPKEGHGWLFGAAGLAMTAEDLARWTLALMDGPVPGPAVRRALGTEVLLADGAGTRYGLGLEVSLESARRVLSHTGEVSGFTADERVYPEQRAAVVVLVNQDFGTAAGTLADRIVEPLLRASEPADSTMDARVRATFDGLRRGAIDPAVLTENGRRYFDATALADFRASLAPLGRPRAFTLTRRGLRGGFVTRVYRVETPKSRLHLVTRATPDGRFEQFMISVE
jgi:D-alanyl-D-alanine carboxypeptidase